MLNKIREKWAKLRNPGFKPPHSDRELMENVRTRLTMLGGLTQPAGTVIRSIPGATVKFITLAGTAPATVFTDDERPVGSILPNGTIVYVQPRA